MKFTIYVPSKRVGMLEVGNIWCAPNELGAAQPDRSDDPRLGRHPPAGPCQNSGGCRDEPEGHLMWDSDTSERVDIFRKLEGE